MDTNLHNSEPTRELPANRWANLLNGMVTGGTTGMVRSWRNRPLLWSAILVLVLTRVWCAFMLGPMGPYGDEDNYVARGVAFWQMANLALKGHPIPEALFQQFYYEGYWPPLFSIVIGPVHILGGYFLTRLFLSLVDIATGLVLWRIAERLIGKTGASIATLIYALCPFFLASSHAIFAEGLYHLFMLIAVWQWLRLIDAPADRDFSVGRILGWVGLGLVMAAAILTRASFVPLLLALVISTAFVCFRRPKALAGMAGATALMFALTMPWNAVIMAKEGRFMFLQTLSQAQMAMKFSLEPTGSWNDLWAKLGDEAKQRGVGREDIAKERVDAYFKANHDRPGVFVNQVTAELVRNYMFGESVLEQRLRMGLYPDKAGRPLWYVLLWQEATRLVIIVGGLIAIMLPIGLFRRRGELALMLASTVAVVLVGNVSGRHFTSALPFLIIASGALAAWLVSQPWRSQMWGWGAAVGFGVLGFAVWNAYPTERVWSASYRNGVETLGRSVEFRDTLRVRRFEDCADQMTLGAYPGDTKVWISGPGIEKAKLEPGDALTPGFVNIIDIENFPRGAPLALPVFVNGRPNMLRFDQGRSADWRSIDDKTCLLFNE